MGRPRWLAAAAAGVNDCGAMRKFLYSLLLVLLVVIVAGLGVSAFYEVPPPVTMMERTIPNDRLAPQ